MSSEGHGGTFNAIGKAWETSLIRWSGHLCNSFGFSSGCLYGLGISGVMLHGAIVFPFTNRYALGMVLQHFWFFSYVEV